jgi:hypothetical protein
VGFSTAGRCTSQRNPAAADHYAHARMIAQDHACAALAQQPACSRSLQQWQTRATASHTTVGNQELWAHVTTHLASLQVLCRQFCRPARQYPHLGHPLPLAGAPAPGCRALSFCSHQCCMLRELQLLDAYWTTFAIVTCGRGKKWCSQLHRIPVQAGQCCAIHTDRGPLCLVWPRLHV